jgi:hypothetical protein
MSMESSFNWISKDWGFNPKSSSWHGKKLINLNDIKELKELNTQQVG